MTHRSVSASIRFLALLLLASCAPNDGTTGPAVASRAGERGLRLASSGAAAAIKVNEVESNGGTPGDWAEFYNTSAVPVDLSGYMFRDSDNTRQYVLPAGTIVPASGFLVLEEAQFGFGLGANDQARLFEPDGITLVDSYAWTAHSTLTYGRCPDGTGAWATTSISTKGAANDCSVLIKINEIESQNGIPGDWVELFNPSASPVALDGYVFRDNSATGYVIPAGTTIPANGYFVIEEAQLPFGIGAPDEARLFRPDGTTLVDSYAWSAHAVTTYGRCPDGIGGFVQTAAPTKGTANSCAAASTAIKVNEVESNGGTPGDWVELYNTGNVPVDLGGYFFRDNDNTRQYIIPSNTVIAPGGFLLLDEAQFGFGLGGADEARLFAPGGVTLVDSYRWTAHATTTYARCPDGTGAFQTSTTSTRGTPNDCGAAVRINEVESNQGTPGDWVELFNAGAATVDLTGYVLRDNNNASTYVLPSGSTIVAGGYLVVDEAQFGVGLGGFGLGGADAVRLFLADGTTLVDSYMWAVHATTTYGRCPNGNGPFATTTVSTKGAANACPGAIVFSPWPGAQTISTADAGGVFGGNMSGLFYQPLTGLPTGVVWAVRNGPGTLHRLTFVNGVWTPRATRTWTNGKALRYPNGTGDVDAEGVTGVGSSIYVAAERNNASNSVSRNSILRYDVSVERGPVLVANLEWDLTADLPANGANLGLEAITRVPDSFLVARSFFDESKNRAYNPADYPSNGGGLFFVGVEANGNIYAYALNHTNGTFTRVATFSSGYASIMDISFDAELGHIWATCDNTCNGRSAVLKIDTQAVSPTLGRFVVSQRFDRPTGMPDVNNEGFTYGPLAECVNGQRPALWADDSETGGFALRRGFITCSPF